MRNAFVNVLMQMAESRPDLMLICGDLGFGVLDPFAKQFPTQFLNAGIAEQNMTGVAAGMALSGRCVITYSIANFPTFRCLEQIRNDVCYHSADVKIVAVGGGYVYGSHGYTHQGIEDIAIMRSLPGMTVLTPGDPVETDMMTRYMLETPGPTYLRLGKGGERSVHTKLPPWCPEEPICVVPGDDVAVLSVGGILSDVQTLISPFQKDLSIALWSLPMVKPLDFDRLADILRSYETIITVEEHTLAGGTGEMIGTALFERGVQCRFHRVGIQDQLSTRSGDLDYLRSFLNHIQHILAHLAAQ